MSRMLTLITYISMLVHPLFLPIATIISNSPPLFLSMAIKNCQPQIILPMVLIIDNSIYFLQQRTRPQSFMLHAYQLPQCLSSNSHAETSIKLQKIVKKKSHFDRSSSIATSTAIPTPLHDMAQEDDEINKKNNNLKAQIAST